LSFRRASPKLQRRSAFAAPPLAHGSQRCFGATAFACQKFAVARLTEPAEPKLPAYAAKPLRRGSEGWLAVRDDFRNWIVAAA
jgi:hypothetical protein